MFIIFNPLLNVRNPGFGYGHLFGSASGKADRQIPGAVPFGFGTVAVGFAATKSSLDERASDDFAEGWELLDDFLAAVEESLFGVHILHILQCKIICQGFFQRKLFFGKVGKVRRK